MAYFSFSPTLQSEIKENLLISMPLLASQLVYSCSGFVGTALIARLGQDALAASVLVVMIWIALSTLFFGLLNSISVLVAHQYGAKDDQAISLIMGQALLLGIFVTLCIIALLFCTPFLLQFTQQPPTVITLAIAYLHAIVWQIPGLVLLVIYEQFLAGINRTKIVLRISLLVVPIEIPIIYVLIFGKFGLPAFGIAGIGYGFAITYSLTALGITLYFLKSKFYQHFGLFSSLGRINQYWLKELIRIGLPMGGMHVIEISAFTFMTFWIAQFGTTQLAAHQIVMQYFWFFITIAFAMSQGLTVRVGHSLGRKEEKNLAMVICTGIMLNFLLTFPVSLFFLYATKLLLHFDFNTLESKNALLLKDSMVLLKVCGLFLFVESYRLVIFGALRGLKMTNFPMWISLLCFCVIGLSSSFILGFTYQWQGAGVWSGMVIGVSIGALILTYKLKQVTQKLM